MSMKERTRNNRQDKHFSGNADKVCLVILCSVFPQHIPKSSSALQSVI